MIMFVYSFIIFYDLSWMYDEAQQPRKTSRSLSLS